MKYWTFVVLFLFLFLYFTIYSTREKNEQIESFTPRINQMWRPHYRNMRSSILSFYSNAQGSFRRYLRQIGLY